MPSNMLLCVSGKLDMETVLGVLDRVLEKEAEPLPGVAEFTESREVVSPCVSREMSVGKPIFTIGIKDTNIPIDARERYKRAQSANILLNAMFSEAGEFYSRMLDGGLISPGLDAGYSASATTGYVMISGESDCPDTVLDEIKKHINNTNTIFTQFFCLFIFIFVFILFQSSTPAISLYIGTLHSYHFRQLPVFPLP